MKITNQADATVTEYQYNGLGHRIGHRWDTDGNASLEWQWYAYDDRWRIVAKFENGSDPDEPTEQIYHHYAGLNGQGGSSYIDLVICRDRDTDSDPSDGMEERSYVLQNWRADVIALADSSGDLLERISYDPYGIPFATHPTDLTLGATSGVSGYGMPSGTLSNDDEFYYLILYGGTDHRADWDRDGDVDANDYTAYTTDKAAATGSWGRGVLSNRRNILGYAGYVHEPATGAAGGGHGTMWHVRHRVLHSGLGRWVQRDPLVLSLVHLATGVTPRCSSGPCSSQEGSTDQPFQPVCGAPNLGVDGELSVFEQIQISNYGQSSPVMMRDGTGLGCRVNFRCTLIRGIQSHFFCKQCYYDCEEVFRGDHWTCPISDIGRVDCDRLPTSPLRRTVVSQRCGCFGGSCPATGETFMLFCDDDLKQDCSKAECRDTCDEALEYAYELCERSPLGPLACRLAAEAIALACRDTCNAICRHE